jgi:hypothetical protein
MSYQSGRGRKMGWWKDVAKLVVSAVAVKVIWWGIHRGLRAWKGRGRAPAN